jgi:glutamate/aspartate transport system ATP-binding protein
MIQLNNVSKQYLGSEISVLSNVNLTIKKGDVVVVCGPSGSGKSTLIKTINGLESINNGNIFLEGMDTALMEAVSLHKTVGMVFQDFALFANMTVLENLVAPQVHVHGADREDATLKAKVQLAAVGMRDHADKYPSQLSGGQQQRVAIARALVTDPDYLLFDEPTSALDPESVQDILDIMTDLATNKKMTLVVVTHEMSFAKKVANRVVFMADGRIVEEAKSDEFFANPKSERAQAFLSKIIR